MGILEKIVQSLNSNSINNNNNSNSRTSVSETIEQYEAQNHVLSHLEDKVQQLLSRQSSVTLNNNNIHSNNSNQQQHALSVVKLQRDFQRVQTRVGQLQEAASKRIVMLRQQQKQVNNQRNNPFGNRSGDGSRLSPFGSGDDSTEDEFMFQQQHQQLQLQEDRLQEEIMREREEEIRNINKGMHTVNEIYKDLAHIVGQQQDHIDQIETQMEDSRANADSGLQQVEKANEKYGNSQCVIM